MGVTVCVGAGDGGSSNNVDPSTNAALPAKDGKVHCAFPSTSPLVLACGGTQLVKSGREVVWNWSNNPPGQPAPPLEIIPRGGATGGGVSEVFPLPDWQSQASIHIQSANPGGGTGRVIPDVAALSAYGDWQIADSLVPQGPLLPAGGTSCSAPLWAALITLVNERRSENGKGAVGFVNEVLYKRAASAQTSLFNDIISGDNRPTPDYRGYEARKGFDACTGWGTPKGAAIFEYLSNLP